MPILLFEPWGEVYSNIDMAINSFLQDKEKELKAAFTNN